MSIWHIACISHSWKYWLCTWYSASCFVPKGAAVGCSEIARHHLESCVQGCISHTYYTVDMYISVVVSAIVTVSALFGQQSVLQMHGIPESWRRPHKYVLCWSWKKVLKWLICICICICWWKCEKGRWCIYKNCSTVDLSQQWIGGIIRKNQQGDNSYRIVYISKGEYQKRYVIDNDNYKYILFWLIACVNIYIYRLPVDFIKP